MKVMWDKKQRRKDKERERRRQAARQAAEARGERPLGVAENHRCFSQLSLRLSRACLGKESFFDSTK